MILKYYLFLIKLFKIVLYNYLTLKNEFFYKYIILINELLIYV